ncbi:hypothetical protein I7I48_06832 [Histoplasma ohiense]|nr:hypothetical protein I7I48_06832 [Histoplasma ohiense (nom. inval.)]
MPGVGADVDADARCCFWCCCARWQRVVEKWRNQQLSQRCVPAGTASSIFGVEDGGVNLIHNSCHPIHGVLLLLLLSSASSASPSQESPMSSSTGIAIAPSQSVHRS